jgi:hypothetical protein
MGVAWKIVTPLNGAELATEKIKGSNYVKYFEFGDTIDSNLIWSSETQILTQSYDRLPDAWYVDGDYFLGIRLKKDDGYQYGWIRFQTFLL